MSGRWFRFYDGALDDPKVQRLSCDLFKLWVNLLCLASRHSGMLPKPVDIAFALRTTPAELGPLLKELVGAGLLDRTDGAWAPHNWNARQFKSDVSNDRVKRHRQRKGNGECNVTSTVTETPSETEADTETDSEQSRADIAQGFRLFNDAAKRTGWPEAQKIDDDRKKLMRARLKDVGGIDGFAIALGKAEASQFLTETWPNFNLDWMLKAKNFRKLMEGNYDKRTDAVRPAGDRILSDFAGAAAALRDKQYHGH